MMPLGGGMNPHSFAPLPPPLHEAPQRRDRASLDPGDEDRISRLVARPYGEQTQHHQAPAHPAPKKSDDPYALHVGTGSAFHRSGKTGFDKTLSRIAMSHRDSYSGISTENRKFLGDVIEEHAKHITTGETIDRHAKLAMKESIEHARQKGNLSVPDAEKFKTIVDHLT